MIRKVSAKRKASTILRFNSTIAVSKPKPKERMTIAQLKASGLLQMARALDNGPKSKTERQKWKAKADKYFSEFIRLRDSDEFGMAYCVTSRKRVRKFWRLMDCGHWISRAKEATRYDERNCHAQSKRANQYQGGHFIEHELAIERIHGNGTAQQLRDKAGQVCKRTAQDYRFLAETYKSRVDRIKTEEPARYFGKGG